MRSRKPLKIIHISGFSRDLSGLPFSIEDDFFFVASWAGLIARRLKAFSPNLDIEVWRAEPAVNKKKIRQVFDLEATLWPYRFPIIKNILTIEMYIHILKLYKTHKIIIHYHSIFDKFAIIKYFLPNDIKLILSHHGGNPPKEGTFKDIFIRRIYKHVDAITYLTIRVKDYLLSIGYDRNRMHFLPVGADFQAIKPINKSKARELLKLDKEKTYAIYVGKFYRLKSVDLILNVYNKLKEKYNFSVIFVGGSENSTNDLYNQVKESGCPYFEKQDWKKMPLFYSAADFYINPAFNPEFGGLDVSWSEALACNRPVLSSKLSCLDFDYKDLGININSESELIEKVEYMINNHHNYNICREYAIRFLDGNTTIVNKLLNIYLKISDLTTIEN